MNVTVNGSETECARTAARPVPLTAEIADCLPFTSGAVSATRVKLGVVNPVSAAPVTGDVSDHMRKYLDGKLITNQ
jgi:hypothetical protein